MILNNINDKTYAISIQFVNFKSYSSHNSLSCLINWLPFSVFFYLNAGLKEWKYKYDNKMIAISHSPTSTHKLTNSFLYWISRWKWKWMRKRENYKQHKVDCFVNNEIIIEHFSFFFFSVLCWFGIDNNFSFLLFYVLISCCVYYSAFHFDIDDDYYYYHYAW